MKALIFVLLFYPSDQSNPIEVATYETLGDCLDIADSLSKDMKGNPPAYARLEKREGDSDSSLGLVCEQRESDK